MKKFPSSSCGSPAGDHSAKINAAAAKLSVYEIERLAFTEAANTATTALTADTKHRNSWWKKLGDRIRSRC